MKNIHILPTLQPSRLWFHKLNRNLGFSDLPMEYNGSGTWVEGRNIYITNDEEIKERDWFTDSNNSLKKNYKLSHVQFANPKKIILTTDQDLIKDGVQAIDDEFLEWLINNPTCEFVEVDKNWNYPLDKSWEYKLRIIPQEEPKQENDYTALLQPVGTKQETLEEFAERLCPNKQVEYDMILEGAKWQQQQDKNKYSDEKEFYKYMAKQDSWKRVGLIIQEFIQLKLKEQDKNKYSEEEVRNIVEQTIEKFYKHRYAETKSEMKELWFQQFKKK